jgi:hypothetical protein
MPSVIAENLVPTIAVAAMAVALLALLLALWAVLRLRRVGRRLAALRGGATEVDAPAAERIDRLARQLAATTDRLEAAETNAEKAIQRVGVVRYNPFEDTGSNQSFVLAMLDAQGDGFVLSSLHSRHASRMYLKSVRAGKADSAISDEEAEALRLAASR